MYAEVYRQSDQDDSDHWGKCEVFFYRGALRKTDLRLTLHNNEGGCIFGRGGDFSLLVHTDISQGLLSQQD